jgi:hypothetical protein
MSDPFLSGHPVSAPACGCHHHPRTMPCGRNESSGSNNRRSEETDKFDEIWSSILGTATDLTRSLVGLPMYYRQHHDTTHLNDRNNVLVVFAEPEILTPQCISFQLDRDIRRIIPPFSLESRAVSVFDIFSQKWKSNQTCDFGLVIDCEGRPDTASWRETLEFKSALRAAQMNPHDLSSKRNCQLGNRRLMKDFKNL